MTGAITARKCGGSIRGVCFTGGIRPILNAFVTAEGFQFDDGSFVRFDDNSTVDIG